nr:MAG TPA: hypothetical protein [Caudoviricetes sp.]
MLFGSDTLGHIIPHSPYACQTFFNTLRTNNTTLFSDPMQSHHQSMLDKRCRIHHNAYNIEAISS